MTTRIINGEQPVQESAGFMTALTAFYHAFNHRQAEAAAGAWLDSDDVIMYNPIGGVRRGHTDILAAYEKIMSGAVVVYVELYDYTLIDGPASACIVGKERGYARYEEKEIELKIRTSRWFRNIGDRWWQVHHHGSIDEPALLADYQRFIQSSHK